AGSLFSCPTLGYARHSIPAVETIVYPPDDSSCVGPRPATGHSLYVGQRSDGTVDYRADGDWYSTTFLRDATGPFPFQDVILRWRCGSTTPAPWVVPCTGGETVTFDDFSMGSDHTVPQGRVEGAVTDEATGDPIEGAWVVALRPSDFQLVGGGATDGGGAYGLDLTPGAYYLYLVDPSGDHAAGFHGGPTEVTVTDGGTTPVDASMAPTTGAVAGTVTDE